MFLYLDTYLVSTIARRQSNQLHLHRNLSGVQLPIAIVLDAECTSPPVSKSETSFRGGTRETLVHIHVAKLYQLGS